MPGDFSEIFIEPIADLEPAEPICVESGTPLSQAIDIMREHRIGCILVTDKRVLTGIFTERDVTVKIVGHSVDLASAIDNFMTPNPETLSTQHQIAYALNRMSLGGYRHVPLVDATGVPTGVISVKDVVDHLVEHFPQDIYNLPPEPDVLPTSAEGA